MGEPPAPVRLPTALRQAIVAHAVAEAPMECCGLLIGAADAIEAVVPARNVRRSATAYLVEPADHFAAIRQARRQGRTVAGAYHSHPRSPAVPSPDDVDEAHDAALLYVIVSLAPAGAGLEPARADVRGYRIEGGRVVEVPLVEQG